MSKISRRTALKQVSAGALTAVAIPSKDWLAEHAQRHSAAADVPLREVLLPGFHAYADAQSVSAGEPIRFFVSSSVPYEMSIVRLGPRIDDFSSDEVLHQFGVASANVQAIRPGSCVVVHKGLTDGEAPRSVAVECWLRLFRVDGPQGILTQGGSSDGFGLFVSTDGKLQFNCGTSVAGPKLERLKWYHIVAGWDGSSVSIWVNGQRIAETKFAGRLELRQSPLLMGAAEVDEKVNQFLDGDLAMPVVYSRALTADEVQKRFDDFGLNPPPADQVVACWPLSEERGDRVHDCGVHGRHGRIINRATWMIGGPSFNGTQIPRYGADYRPDQDDRRGHGLRFAADDLYDCRWQPSHEYLVPEDAKSGIYCARATFEIDGKPKIDHVTFVVKKSAVRPKSPIVVLCSSNTWLAYNSTPFSVNRPVGARTNVSTAGGENSHPLAPTYSCYLNHRAGQPSYQFGLRMPWPVAAPDVLYSAPDTGYSHLMRGERFAHVWLDENGYEYDVITDLDLHRQPDLLNGYKTILINGHSEYWSIEAYQGVDRFLSAGGNAIIFSGNTMFWRVTFSPDESVMECRKYDDRIGGMTHATIGELYHSHDGRRGSLMRECGFPAWQIIGLECDGWGGINKDDFGVYHTESADHFLFQQPERVGLAVNDTFGHAPDGGVPRAIGHEWDVRVSRLNAMTKKIPDGQSLPKEPAGIVTLARGIRNQKSALDYFTQPTNAPDGVVAEMIYWERPQGGRVFHGGAIAVGWALSADPKLQSLIRNVLHHFGVQPKKKPDVDR